MMLGYLYEVELCWGGFRGNFGIFFEFTVSIFDNLTVLTVTDNVRRA
jgi:hypothetical protein